MSFADKLTLVFALWGVLLGVVTLDKMDSNVDVSMWGWASLAAFAVASIAYLYSR